MSVIRQHDADRGRGLHRYFVLRVQFIDPVVDSLYIQSILCFNFLLYEEACRDLARSTNLLPAA